MNLNPGFLNLSTQQKIYLSTTGNTFGNYVRYTLIYWVI